MKLKAFEKLKLTKNIYGYKLVNVNVSISDVLHYRICNVTPHLNYSLVISKGEIKKVYDKIKLWKFRNPKVEEFVGFLTATNSAELAEYIANNYIPCNDDSLIDKLFTQFKKPILKDEIYKLFKEEERRSYYRIFDDSRLALGKILWPEKDDKVKLTTFGEGKYYFVSSQNYSQTLYSPVEQKIANKKIRFWKFICIDYSVLYPSSIGNFHNLFIWDGKQHQSYLGTLSIEKLFENFSDMIKEIDTNGLVESTPFADIFNLNHFFKATHIIRVPPISELKTLDFEKYIRLKPIIRNSLVLFNEFSPIFIDKDVIFIDDPKEVLPILSRSLFSSKREIGDNSYLVFVPDDAPGPIEVSNFIEEEIFLIGCKLKDFVK